MTVGPTRPQQSVAAPRSVVMLAQTSKISVALILVKIEQGKLQMNEIYL
jgi:hypothetical protein